MRESNSFLVEKLWGKNCGEKIIRLTLLSKNIPKSVKIKAY